MNADIFYSIIPRLNKKSIIQFKEKLNEDTILYKMSFYKGKKLNTLQSKKLVSMFKLLIKLNKENIFYSYINILHPNKIVNLCLYIGKNDQEFNLQILYNYILSNTKKDKFEYLCKCISFLKI